MSKKKIEPPLPPSSAQLVWFDPGSTTGIFVVNVEPEWLSGEGRANLSGLRSAILTFAHMQVGRYAREDEDLGALPAPTRSAASGHGIKVCDMQELRSVLAGLEVLARHPHAAWGYEDFRTRMISQADDFLSSPRVGSSLRDAMMLGNPPRPPFRQDPSDMLALPDERMQALGLYRRGMPHATDAARHGALFLRRARQDPELRAEAWPHLFGDAK